MYLIFKIVLTVHWILFIATGKLYDDPMNQKMLETHNQCRQDVYFNHAKAQNSPDGVFPLLKPPWGAWTLTWDSGLADSASTWADTLRGKVHSIYAEGFEQGKTATEIEEDVADKVWSPSRIHSLGEYGENIARVPFVERLPPKFRKQYFETDAVYGWYNEKDDLPSEFFREGLICSEDVLASVERGKKILHLTQLIWQNTKRVGCGYSEIYIKHKGSAASAVSAVSDVSDVSKYVYIVVCQYDPAGNVGSLPVYNYQHGESSAEPEPIWREEAPKKKRARARLEARKPTRKTTRKKGSATKFTSGRTHTKKRRSVEKKPTFDTDTWRSAFRGYVGYNNYNDFYDGYVGYDGFDYYDKAPLQSRKEQAAYVNRLIAEYQNYY